MVVYNVESDCYSDVAIELWQQNGYIYTKGSWEDIESIDINPDVSILIVRLKKYINKILLDKFPNLKYILTATTGLDHLDLNEINKKGIQLFCLRGHDDFLQTIPSTAELTFGLILSLLRNIPAANDSVKNLKWNRNEFKGYQLAGKSIGIIGLGRLGLKIANYAKVFGMIIYYYDPYVNNVNLNKCSELIELLSQCDIISLHVHLNDETENMINIENIHHIKNGAYLINTSRGAIWDEEVIVNALYNKKIRGIAADVITNELYDIRTSPLVKAQQKGENIIITPHLGGATYDAMNMCEEYLVDNFLRNTKDLIIY